MKLKEMITQFLFQGFGWQEGEDWEVMVGLGVCGFGAGRYIWRVGCSLGDKSRFGDRKDFGG